MALLKSWDFKGEKCQRITHLKKNLHLKTVNTFSKWLSIQLVFEMFIE